MFSMRAANLWTRLVQILTESARFFAGLAASSRRSDRRLMQRANIGEALTMLEMPAGALMWCM